MTKEKVVQCFSGNTSAIKMMSTKDNRENAKALIIIHKWAEEYLMEFNEKKFEELSHKRHNSYIIQFKLSHK